MADPADHLANALGLNPVERSLFVRAWQRAGDAPSVESLQSEVFGADRKGAPAPTGRHAAGVGSLGDLTWLISIVFAATRTLMYLSKNFVESRPDAAAVDRKLLEELLAAGLPEDRAKERAQQLGAALLESLLRKGE